MLLILFFLSLSLFFSISLSSLTFFFFFFIYTISLLSYTYTHRAKSSGYIYEDLFQLNAYDEQINQMAPSLRRARRQFLCLTTSALHIITQRRPVDYMYSLLREATVRVEVVKEIKEQLYDYYGLEQCCNMCVAIACDLPTDVTVPIAGGSGLANVNNEQKVTAIRYVYDSNSFL